MSPQLNQQLQLQNQDRGQKWKAKHQRLLRISATTAPVQRQETESIIGDPIVLRRCIEPMSTLVGVRRVRGIRTFQRVRLIARKLLALGESDSPVSNAYES